MLTAVAKAVQALAVWRYVESSSAQGDASQADLKSHAAHAHQAFTRAAYEVAFALVPRLLEFGEIVTKNEVRYAPMVTRDGEFIVQKMNLDPDNPGLFLTPEGVTVPAVVPIPPPSTENWLQLFIDLPELLEILEVK
jgi:hypothetical protein